MTKSEFVEKNKHELSGVMMEAFTTQLRGGPQAELLRRLMAKCDTLLGNYYDTLITTKPEPVKQVGLSGGNPPKK